MCWVLYNGEWVLINWDAISKQINNIFFSLHVGRQAVWEVLWDQDSGGGGGEVGWGEGTHSKAGRGNGGTSEGAGTSVPWPWKEEVQAVFLSLGPTPHPSPLGRRGHGARRCEKHSNHFFKSVNLVVFFLCVMAFAPTWCKTESDSLNFVQET